MATCLAWWSDRANSGLCKFASDKIWARNEGVAPPKTGFALRPRPTIERGRMEEGTMRNSFELAMLGSVRMKAKRDLRCLIFN
jgi:hypothetical protein